MGTNNSIISSLDLLDSIQSDIGDEYTNLFELAKRVHQIKNDYKSKLPYHINVIDELYINENAHSRILAKLLHFRSSSGAYEILESLIEFIKRKKQSDEFDRIKVIAPSITQEEERIDLWICDHEANNALIFENKIYDAPDQKSQLFRYIKKTKERKFAEDNIFVFYLTKNGNEPSEQTWGNEETKLNFKNRYMPLSYRNDLLPWLKHIVLPNVRIKDKYLQCAINQYVDYLEGLFSIREIYNNLNMEIQKIISDRLQLDSCNEEQVVKKIEDTIENLDETRNHLVQMLAKAKRNLWSLYLPNLTTIVESVASQNRMKSEVGFLDEESSRFYISLFKNKWNMQIVFEKYDENDDFFVYIGRKGEEYIDEGYTDGKFIFESQTYKRQHPYGWESVEKYNQDSAALMQDIKNGKFEEYLSEEVSDVLDVIRDENLIM